MKHKLYSIFHPIVMTLVALCLAAGCTPQPNGGNPLPPEPMTPEQMAAACGEGCTLVGFVFDLYDEDLTPVPLMEGHVAAFTIEAWEADPQGGPPRYKEILDADKGAFVPTPYVFDDEIPMTSLHGIPSGVIHVIMTATTFIPAGWTFKCKTLVRGMPIDQPVSSDSFTTPTDPDAEGVMGIPSDATVHCSWPFPGLDDIT